MSEDASNPLDLLPDLIVDAIDAIDVALEEKTRVNVAAAHEKVKNAVGTYEQVRAAAQGEARATIEQRFDRRVTDLKRQADRLPQGAVGRHAELSLDAGSVPFIEQRAPGKSNQWIDPPRSREAAPAHTTGGEVEAWCGPCGGMRTHNIYALVDGRPGKVICQSCGASHGYRTTPARKGPAVAKRPIESTRAPTHEQREADQKRKQQNALREELATAQTVRAFAPKERYKAGEIIEHPEYGRGKIENTTRGSLLVRFVSGLRPLNLT